MPIVNPDIEAYLREQLGSGDPVQARMEAVAEERGFPIVGPLVGRLLELLAGSIRAKRVLELGSGFGYSTFFFARAVGSDGSVVHTDWSADNQRQAKEFLSEAGLLERVEFELGDALQALHRSRGPFDIIFCDIDKEGYPQAAEAALSKLRVGGLLIFDNALWGGQVLQPQPADEATRGVRTLHEILFGREDVLTTVLPVRDGVSVSLKLQAA